MNIQKLDKKREDFFYSTAYELYGIGRKGNLSNTMNDILRFVEENKELFKATRKKWASMPGDNTL